MQLYVTRRLCKSKRFTIIHVYHESTIKKGLSCFLDFPNNCYMSSYSRKINGIHLLDHIKFVLPNSQAHNDPMKKGLRYLQRRLATTASFLYHPLGAPQSLYYGWGSAETKFYGDMSIRSTLLPVRAACIIHCVRRMYNFISYERQR